MATWAERFDQARLYNQQRERENAFNDLVASAYTPERTVTTQVPTYGPMQDGSVPPVVSQTNTVPGGMDWKTLIGRLAQGGFGQQALQLDQMLRSQQQEQDMQRLFASGGMRPGMTMEKTPQGWRYGFDPAKAQEADISARRFSDETGQTFTGAGTGGVTAYSGSGGLPVSPKQAREIAVKRAEEMPTAQKSAQNLLSAIDIMDAMIEQIKQHGGTPNATGRFMGSVPMLTESGNDASKLINSLKSQVSLSVVNAAREASKTGGAYGNMTEKEWPRMESVYASVDPGQSTQQFLQQLDDIKAYNKSMRDRIQSSYANTYGGNLRYEPFVPPSLKQNVNQTNSTNGNAKQESRTDQYKIGDIVYAPNGQKVLIQSLKPDGTPDDVMSIK